MAQQSDNPALRLVVVMPALNEQATVASTIRRIPAAMPGVADVRVLVVDDGSTDATAAEARAAGARVVSHGRRQGVGAAFQTALANALAMDADLVVSIDADGQFDPATIPALITPVVAGQADFATASRFADPALVPEMPAVKLWGNRMMSRLISRFCGQKFHDVSCGMRCYNRRAALSLNLIGAFTYTQEVFLNLAYKRMRMVEVPIRVQGVRSHGKSRVAGNLWRYGLRTLAIVFRCYRDYQPMRFFGRLALAFMLPGLGLEVFLWIHYLRQGAFHPHIWAGFTGAALFVLGLGLLLVGVIGDMLNRHRMYLEELLYHVRSRPGGQVHQPDQANEVAGKNRQ
jgi:glycosyltransferase involved in cell wall biosynthesis